MATNDDDLHPVRFTNKQIRTIEHIIDFSSDHFEEESEEFFDIIKKCEETRNAILQNSTDAHRSM